MDKFLYKDGACLPLGMCTLEINIVHDGEPDRIRVYASRDSIDGKTVNLSFHDMPKEGMVILNIETSVRYRPVFFRECAVKWLREYARFVLTEKARHYSSIMGVTFKRIAIKEQKTRWGSCSSKGNLNFNWKLLLMPDDMQDYVVVHELAHLIELNHSKAFWAQVGAVIPDYRERVRWQREHEREYVKY